MIKEEKDFKENTIDGDFTKPRKDIPLNSKKSNKGKKGKKGKGKKGNKNFNSTKGLEAVTKGIDMGGVSHSNDISWYSKNPELLQQAGNLSWGYKLGLPVNYTNENFMFRVLDNKPLTRVPGFMFVGVIPGPGVTADSDAFQESDAVNLAAKDQYAYIRYANSGHANYDPQDLMLYYLAWDEIQMEIYDAMRAYGIANITNMQNRYMPRALVQALGWDYEAIVSDRANFASKINSAIARIGAFPVPKGMHYFSRHEWLFSNLFTDETSLKSQIFGFKKVMYRVFEHNAGENGGALVSHIRPGATGKTLLTPTAWFNGVLEMINRIADSEDMGIIMGDILKAWGTENCMTLDYMSQDYICKPAYDETVKCQFENMYIHSSLLSDPYCEPGSPWKGIEVYNITQNPNIDMGRIVYKPYIKQVSIYANPDFRPTDDREFNAINPTSGNAVLNIHKDTATVQDTVYATRGIAPAKLSVNAVSPTVEEPRSTTTGGYIGKFAYRAYGKIMTAGTEIFVDGRIFSFVEMAHSNYATDYNSGLAVRSCNTVQISEEGIFSYPSPNSKLLSYPDGKIEETLEYIDPFSQHVNIWKVAPTWMVKNNGDVDGFVHIDYNKYYDLDNYTTIHPETLRNLHDQCLLSEFNVPVTIKVKGQIGR